MALFEENKTYKLNFAFKNNSNYEITLREEPSSDTDVFRQIFEFQEYKPLVDLIQKENKTKENFCILDAGANIGLTSIYLNCYFPGSRYIIVEPDQENFKLLRLNIKKNNILHTNLVPGGIWHKETYLKTEKEFRDGNDWAITVVESDLLTDIKGFTIPGLMKKFDFKMIDILKIDVEGSEKKLFQDHETASLFLSKTRYIAMEIHDEFECRSNIYKCLNKNNFDFFDTGELTIGKNKSPGLQ